MNEQSTSSVQLQQEATKSLLYFKELYSEYINYFESKNVTVKLTINFLQAQKKSSSISLNKRKIPVLLHISVYPKGYSENRAKHEYVYQDFYSNIGEISRKENLVFFKKNTKKDRAVVYFLKRLMKRIDKKSKSHPLKEHFLDVIVNTFYIRRFGSFFSKTYHGEPWYIVWVFIAIILILTFRILVPTGYRFIIYNW